MTTETQRCPCGKDHREGKKENREGVKENHTTADPILITGGWGVADQSINYATGGYAAQMEWSTDTGTADDFRATAGWRLDNIRVALNEQHEAQARVNPSRVQRHPHPRRERELRTPMDEMARSGTHAYLTPPTQPSVDAIVHAWEEEVRRHNRGRRFELSQYPVGSSFVLHQGWRGTTPDLTVSVAHTPAPGRFRLIVAREEHQTVVLAHSVRGSAPQTAQGPAWWAEYTSDRYQVMRRPFERNRHAGPIPRLEIEHR